MGSIIHGLSHKVLKHFRRHEGALAVYWIYCSRVNKDNVSWPSLRGLERDTGWNKTTCGKYRDWLVERGALERVMYYVRPQWRNLEPNALKKKLGMDKAQYLRPTGVFVTEDGEQLDLLYVPGGTPATVDEPEPVEQTVDEESSTDEPAPDALRDVQPRTMSSPVDVHAGRTSAGIDIRPGRTELNTTSELDSKFELDSTSELQSSVLRGGPWDDSKKATDDRHSSGHDDNENNLEKIGEVIAAYENNLFGDITAFVAADIKAACLDHGVNNVLDAMKETVLRNATNKWAYTLAILKDFDEKDKRARAHGLKDRHELKERGV